MKDHNNEIEELFLKDNMYQFMLKQFEKDPEAQKMLDIYEKYGVNKSKAIPILLELTDMQEEENNDENVAELLDAKMNRIFKKIERIEHKIDQLDYKIDNK